MNSKELGQMSEEMKEILELREENNVPTLVRLQKARLDIQMASELVRTKLPRMMNTTGNNAILVSTALRLDQISDMISKEIDKIAKDTSRFEAKRNIPSECHTCGETNYITRQEFLTSSQICCTRCNNPL